MLDKNEFGNITGKTFKVLKAEDVATILNVSRSFAYQLMQRGQLHTVRFGHAVRVHPAELERFISQNSFGGTDYPG